MSKVFVLNPGDMQDVRTFVTEPLALVQFRKMKEAGGWPKLYSYSRRKFSEFYPDEKAWFPVLRDNLPIKVIEAAETLSQNKT